MNLPCVLNIPQSTQDILRMYSWYPLMYWTSSDVLNTYYAECLRWCMFLISMQILSNAPLIVRWKHHYALIILTYSMFHVTWTTFKFNRNQLRTVSAYVIWLWLIAFLMCTLKWLSSIEVQCRKRFNLKPKAAIDNTEISSLICKTILIFNKHRFQYLLVVPQWNSLESNFSLMTWWTRWLLCGTEITTKAETVPCWT